MTDVFSKPKRSEVMSKIRASGNRSTELRLIDIFKQSRIIGWRRNYPLIGRPDFVFPSNRTVVFVDGCFWHSCPKCSNMPKQNADFWKKKLSRNIERDGEVTKALRRNGWRVIRIWEHELNSVTGVARRIGMPKPGERNARTKRSRAA